MLGLLYKDFYTAKKELLLTGFMALLFVGYNLIIGQKEMLGPSIGVLVSVGSLVPTYSIHYDKANNWNKFVCASPLSRTKVVLSKYIAGIASIVVMNLLIVVDNAAIRGAFDFVERNAGLLGPIAAVAVAALYVGSFFLTRWFYKKMEF